MAGRVDTPFFAGRPVAHVRVNKDLPAAAPFDDELREVLPLLAQWRDDPFFGPVFAYLEIAATDHSAAWPGAPVAKPISTATLLDISAACFLGVEGILRRHRVRTRNCHSVRVPKYSKDRVLVCVPRALRQPLLTFYHERSGHGV